MFRNRVAQRRSSGNVEASSILVSDDQNNYPVLKSPLVLTAIILTLLTLIGLGWLLILEEAKNDHNIANQRVVISSNRISQINNNRQRRFRLQNAYSLRHRPVSRVRRQIQGGSAGTVATSTETTDVADSYQTAYISAFSTDADTTQDPDLETTVPTLTHADATSYTDITISEVNTTSYDLTTVYLPSTATTIQQDAGGTLDTTSFSDDQTSQATTLRGDDVTTDVIAYVTTDDYTTGTRPQPTSATTIPSDLTMQTSNLTTSGDDATDVVLEEDEGPLMVAWYWLIVAAILPLAILLGVIGCYRLWLIRTKRKTIYTHLGVQIDSIESDSISLTSWTLQMEREDALRDAIGMGNIAVLEFALKEARNLSDKNSVDEKLIAKAEKKLYEWKRVRNQLTNALDRRDVEAVEDYASRFKQLDINDDTGVYARSIELLWHRNEIKARMRAASIELDEKECLASIARFEALNLPDAYVTEDADLQAAKAAIQHIRQKALLQGREMQQVRVALTDAVENANVRLINSNLHLLQAAAVPSDDQDVLIAKQKLADIEQEKLRKEKKAWFDLQEAMRARNQAQLRAAMQKCADVGLDHKHISDGEMCLKVVEREDELLDALAAHIRDKDSPKMLEAIAVFRTPGSQLVDKRELVPEAEELIQKLADIEKLRRTKRDIILRLRNALSVGDAALIQAMITSIEALQDEGEEVDEALMIRAKSTLEELRGLADYRRQIETIKSAIQRAIETENLPQLSDLIEQMVEMANRTNFIMTPNDSVVLDESRARLSSLTRKQATIAELRSLRPLLQLPQIPDNVDTLQKAVLRTGQLKHLSDEWAGVFTADDDLLLHEVKMKTEELVVQLHEKDQATAALADAIQRRNYDSLVATISRAEIAQYFDAFDDLATARMVTDLVNPAKVQLEDAIGKRDYEGLMAAISQADTATLFDSTVLDNDLAEAREIADLVNPVTVQLAEAIEHRDYHALMTAISSADTAHFFVSRDDDVAMARDISDSVHPALVQLAAAIETREFESLITAIAKADTATFFKPRVVEADMARAREIADFVNPLTRRQAIRDAIRAGDIEQIQTACRDYKRANVPGGDVLLLSKAERKVQKLQKRELKRQREEERRRQEQSRREADINRLNSMLEEAIDSRDIDKLQIALDVVDNSEYSDSEIPLFTAAEELFDELKIRALVAKIEDGIDRRDLHMLEESIDEADFQGFTEDIGHHYRMAKDLIFHLKELHGLRDSISSMTRAMISEVNRYPTPPAIVHRVMSAALVMLGERPADVEKWTDVQALLGKLGKDSITRRVRVRAPGDISAETAIAVENMIDGLTVANCNEKSRCAGCFLAWTICMLHEVEFILAR